MNPMLFAPELSLLLGSLVLFFAGTCTLAAKTARRLSLAVALFTSLVSLLCLNQEGVLFYGAYQVDFFSQLLKLILSLGLLTVLLFATDLKGIDDGVRPEYYLFLSLSTLGLLMLVSSVELLSMFIALELSSFSLYLLVPMRSDRAGLRVQMESGIKYILFGVVATGIMLFGMSYLFGLTGSTYFVEMSPRLHSMMGYPPTLIAIGMVMAGFFFKLGIFPFHFWVPDVYQGASNETTAYIASVPKIAAVAILIRLATLVSPVGTDLVALLAVVAACSMFYGNLAALVQTDLKRMLGFSGIAHAGYVLLGVLTLEASGFAVSLYYIVGYFVMSLAGFLVIAKVSREGENLTINDLSGLHSRSPFLALLMAVSMFGLAGIPPFAGFMGKFMLLTGAYKAGHLALVILAAINTAISIYYYLSVVRVCYSVDAGERPTVALDLTSRLVGLVLVLVILGLGLFPEQVIQIASRAVGALLP